MKYNIVIAVFIMSLFVTDSVFAQNNRPAQTERKASEIAVNGSNAAVVSFDYPGIIVPSDDVIVIPTVPGTHAPFGPAAGPVSKTSPLNPSMAKPKEAIP